VYFFKLVEEDVVFWYLLLGFPNFPHLFEPGIFMCTLATSHMLLVGFNSL
jgi:hypothetical protein